MADVTLANLISRARSRADMPLTGFVTDAEVVDWLNEGVQKLHEKLVSAYSEEYVSSTGLLVVQAGGIVASLPTDFFKLLTIEMNIAGVTCTLLPYMQQERNAYRNSLSLPSGTKPRYKIVAGNVRLFPAQVQGTQINITYAPEATLLLVSTPTQTVNFPNGWEKYAVLYAAIQMMDKEETGTARAQSLLDTWDKELEALKQSRDNAAPKQSIDMDLVESDDPVWRI